MHVYHIHMYFSIYCDFRKKWGLGDGSGGKISMFRLVRLDAKVRGYGKKQW
jgi:hypothetical protein